MKQDNHYKRTKKFSRIFIDCSRTFVKGGNRGIQRVDRNIINNCAEAGRYFGVECIPIIWNAGEFVRIRGIQQSDLEFGQVTKPRRPSEILPPSRLQMALRLVRRFLGRHSTFLRRFPINDARCEIQHRFMLHYQTFRHRLRYLSGRKKPMVDFGPDDILLLLDSRNIPLWHGLDQARASGTRIGFILYDLIPIISPDTCDENLVQRFREWFKRLCSRTDFCITISKAVAQEYLDHVCSSLGRDKVAPRNIATFTLGANLEGNVGDDNVRPELCKIFKTGPKPYISVGAIEARKNHKYLLDAFGELWSNGVDVKVVLIGKAPRRNNEIMKLINAHLQLGTRLFLFHDLSDNELSYCYRNSKALIFPSVCEGFGLPIVEALHHRIPALVSDIPVHREVGGDYCAYFSLEAPHVLSQMIRDLENDKIMMRKSAKDFCWPSWQESCRELIGATLSLAQSLPQTAAEKKLRG